MLFRNVIYTLTLGLLTESNKELQLTKTGYLVFFIFLLPFFFHYLSIRDHLLLVPHSELVFMTKVLLSNRAEVLGNSFSLEITLHEDRSIKIFFIS